MANWVALVVGWVGWCRGWLRGWRLLWLAALAAALLVPAPVHADSPNLLSLKVPSHSDGVRNVKALTDGVRATEGDDWNTDLTAVFGSARAFVEFDLGSEVTVKAVYLQGDNNDRYRVELSKDGKRYEEAWLAPTVREPGLRGRSTSTLSRSGRFLRITSQGGDGAYSLSEVQAWSEKPSVFPPDLRDRRGQAQAPRVRAAILLFVLAMAAFLYAVDRRTPRGWLLGAAMAPLGAAYLLVDTVSAMWPLGGREVSLLRAASAAIALLALGRELVLRKRFPAHPLAGASALVVSAALAFGSFYNLTQPQFWNHKEARPEFVHTWDMRVYYPFAKYFEEVRYDGVYLASVAAYVDDVPGASLESLGNTEIRDLTNHKTRHVSDMVKEIEAVKKRFTPERWQDFRRDMTYFREVMGAEYLATHHDHGSNATPVWTAFARLVFAGGPATEGRLVFGGLIDAFLLLGAFFAIYRTFGLRLMCVAMVVFGANDFYMFGTNWGGATLRHDWLAYLAFGVCALKAERWILAGAMLGLSTMIRAFPGAALIGVALPAAWWAFEHVLERKRLPSWKSLRAEHEPALRVAAGAAGMALLSFLATVVWFGLDVWIEWWDKITRLNSELGLNDVSLASLTAGSDGFLYGPLRARRLIFVVAAVVGCGIIALCCRRRRLDQAAILSLPLIPLLTNPANYYVHFIFLLPLLATRRTGLPNADEGPPGSIPMKLPIFAASASMLGVCVAQYWTVLDSDLERHFQAATALCFAGLGFLYANVLKRTPLPGDDESEEAEAA